MKHNPTNHIFVVLAYKESIFLEECVLSLIHQTVETPIIIATSTPNSHIETIAKKYSLPTIINPFQKKGIGFDFDFALFCTRSNFVTIAHQDDIYEKEYAETLQNFLKPDTLIAFSDCYEIKSGIHKKNTLNLQIKRILLFPLQLKIFQKSVFIKRMCLAFGNPICCPAVTFHQQKMKHPLFETTRLSSNMDWQAWELLSKERGGFVFIPKKLMGHRIHAASTTSAIIQNNQRFLEDLLLFKKFWPTGIAQILARLYKLSEKNNTLSSKESD